MLQDLASRLQQQRWQHFMKPGYREVEAFDLHSQSQKQQQKLARQQQELVGRHMHTVPIKVALASTNQPGWGLLRVGNDRFASGLQAADSEGIKC